MNVVLSCYPACDTKLWDICCMLPPSRQYLTRGVADSGYRHIAITIDFKILKNLDTRMPRYYFQKFMGKNFCWTFSQFLPWLYILKYHVFLKQLLTFTFFLKSHINIFNRSRLPIPLPWLPFRIDPVAMASSLHRFRCHGFQFASILLPWLWFRIILLSWHPVRISSVAMVSNRINSIAMVSISHQFCCHGFHFASILLPWPPFCSDSVAMASNSHRLLPWFPFHMDSDFFSCILHFRYF